MTSTTLKELIPVLQIAIGPVILVSGVGLLLLSMTNRLGRAIDRARLLSGALREMGDSVQAPVLAQLKILLRRARLIRLAIILASVSVLMAAILVIVLFLSVLLGFENAWPISALFIACMASLIGSLITFIVDLNQSLLALKMELSNQLTPFGK
jgi:hypothetical protein